MAGNLLYSTVNQDRVLTQYLRQLLLDAEETTLRVLARVPWPRRWFYRALFGRRYRREMNVVLAGRLRHGTTKAGGVSRLRSDAALRRGIHRLEKGLTMKPRISVFAVDYITETIDALEQAVSRREHSSVELQWAIDVLAAYFLIVDEVPVVRAAKSRFQKLIEIAAISRSLNANPDGMTPKNHAEISQHVIGYDALLGLLRKRKSVRWFDGSPVHKDLIDKAILAAGYAPSACNRQPFFFHVINGPIETERIASIAMGTAGYAQQIPSLIVVLGDFSSFENERDRHLPYIDGSLASMQLMLALETLGLGSCPINWPDIEARERSMASALSLPDYLRPIMLIAVGYPDPKGKVAYSAKKSVDDLSY